MSDTGKTSSDHKTATPAEIAWANSVIKRNIVRNVKKKALPTLLRVNQETHMLAVEELYRHLEDCKTVMSHLSRMNNYSRNLRYRQAVRRVESFDARSNPTILPLFAMFPNLQSLLTAKGQECRLRQDAGTGKVTALITIAESQDGEERRSVEKFMPGDWAVQYQEVKVEIKKPEDWSTWKSRQPPPTVLPRLLTLTGLGSSLLAEIVTYAKSCDVSQYAKSWDGSRSDCEIYLDVTRSDAPHWEDEDMAAQLPILAQHFTSIVIIRTAMTVDDVLYFAKELGSFRFISIPIVIWKPSKSQPSPSLRPALQDDRLQSNRLEIVICYIDGSEIPGDPLTLAAALAELIDNEIWLGAWANGLLCAFGPLPAYSVSIGVKEIWRTHHPRGETQFDMAVSQAEAMLSRRLNDIISTIVDCRRCLRAPGWRLSTPAPKHGEPTTALTAASGSSVTVVESQATVD